MLLQEYQEVVSYADMDKDYAEVLITAMRRKGITQQQLAEAIGLDNSTVSRKLQPGHRWWVDQYVKALDCLEIDPIEALGQGRRVGEITVEKGGLMGDVVKLVQNLKFCREEPERAVEVLHQIGALERRAPDVFAKLLHDINYQPDQLKKEPATPRKKSA